MLVGQPKKLNLEEAQPADVSTFEEGQQTVGRLLEEGQPPEMPVGLPTGMVYQIFLAANRYVDVAKKIVELDSEDNEELAAIQEQAQALLDQKPVPLRSTSRILTPN